MLVFKVFIYLFGCTGYYSQHGDQFTDQGPSLCPIYDGRRVWVTGPLGKSQEQVCVCVCDKLHNRVRLFATPRTVAHQAPLSMGLFRQECWSGVPCPPPRIIPTQGSNLHHSEFLTTSVSWETPRKGLNARILIQFKVISSCYGLTKMATSIFQQLHVSFYRDHWHTPSNLNHVDAN